MTSVTGMNYLRSKEFIQPIAGEIYRDRFDQSFFVISQNLDNVLVEYASGKVCRISDKGWKSLEPTPAAF